MRNLKFSGKLSAVAVLFVFILGLTGTAFAEHATNYADALKRADHGGKLVIIDFFTDW